MSSLKDWMDKRNERRQSAKANNGGKQRPGGESENTSSSAEDPDPGDLGDFSNIPPPPPPRNRAREHRLVPPTSGPRHRQRSGAQTQPAPSTSAPPAKTKTRTPSPNGSAFSEHFDRQSPKTVTRVHGVDFEMSTTAPDGADGATSGSDENRPGGDRGGGDIKTRRSSRSQTRRQERADSHQMIEEDADKADGLNLTLDIPESLQLHKTPAGRAPSPSPQETDSTQPSAEARKGTDGALRQLSNMAPESGDDTTSLPQPTNKKIGTATTTTPPRSKGGVSPFIQRLRGSLSKPSTTPPVPPTFIPPDDDEPDLRKFINADKPTVAIRPPIPDMSKNTAQQWESDLGSTSRPARAWDWTKRWTCCQCEAQTIVEQIVCSNLDCVHDRCPDSCRVVRWGRPRGEYPMTA